MNHDAALSISRVRELLSAAAKTHALVIGDVMLDQFLWGGVSRISPEAPVPVVDFQRESFMPGGAANVARNLTALGMPAEIFSVVGTDSAASQLRELLLLHQVDCDGLVASNDRHTTLKTRVVAHQQQVCRIDRESRKDLTPAENTRLLELVLAKMPQVDAVIVGDYGKGVISDALLAELKQLCKSKAVWLSLDPKPVHRLDLNGLSLITPNRKEAFELAGIEDDTRNANPLADKNLMLVAERLLDGLKPALLLITLGELGMLLCQRGQKPYHIPTIAREVFDVSGAGDTVIATFTLAIAAGASPLEAAIFSNHAAGIVVGKVGTAVATPGELLASFEKR